MASFSKSAMTRHLEICEQRAITEAKAGSRQKAQQTRKLHLVVEACDLAMYWMHLAVTFSTVLTTLDQFLSDTWLECWGQSMQVRLDKVLSPGQICSYEYDYGTMKELKLKVISERQVAAKGNAIQV